MTEASRIALECQRHLGFHLNALNLAGQFAADVSKLEESQFERIIPLALANHVISSPSGREQREDEIRGYRHAFADFGFARIDAELRAIDSDIQKNIGGGIRISPNFYNLTVRSLQEISPSRHSLEGTIENLPVAIRVMREHVKTGQSDKDAPGLVFDSLMSVHAYLAGISSCMKSIRLFDKIKDVNTNIIFVGANGSGKSTLAREMNAALGIMSSAIAAQQPIGYAEGRINLFDAGYSKQAIQQRQRDPAQGAAGLHNLMVCLLAEYVKSAINEKRHGADADSYGKPPLLDRVFELWGKIIPSRKLHYDIGNQAIWAINLERGATKYPIGALSDGERTALYYIAYVVLAAPNEYIVVDEPENNLNLAVVNRLWDALEKLRPDCQFVYLTHNPDFAMGRKNARTLWIKNVIPNSGEWDYEELPAKDAFGERLMIELVGERRKVLFCESKPKGIDPDVYGVLFPDHSVKPVGGNQKVIDCVRAHKSMGVFPYSAMGVIDGDFRTESEAEALRQDSIHCLALPAVENLLFDAELLQAAAQQFYKPTAFSHARNRLFALLEKHKFKLAAHYAHNVAAKQLKNQTPEAGNTLECVIERWGGVALPQGDTIRRAYDERLKAIEDAINGKQYAKGLALYHCKSVMGVGEVIVNNYKDRVLSFLRETPALRKMLVGKYLPGLLAE